MSGRTGVGELHHHGALRSVDINRVVVPGKLAVEVKSPTGAGRRLDGDGGALLLLDRGAWREVRPGAAIGSKARQHYDRAAATDRNARHCRGAAGAIACATGADGRRDAGTGGGIRSAACSGASGSAAFTGHAATRALTVTDA